MSAMLLNVHVCDHVCAHLELTDQVYAKASFDADACALHILMVMMSY